MASACVTQPLSDQMNPEIAHFFCRQGRYDKAVQNQRQGQGGNKGITDVYVPAGELHQS